MQLPLEPCRRYIAGVSVLESDLVSSPMPQNWLRFRTPYNPKAPPANPFHISVGRTIRFTWEHDCLLKDQQPTHYLFKIYDLTMKSNETVEINGMSYEYRMAKGAKYRFELSTSYPQALPVVWNVTAPTLPTPTNFSASQTNETNIFQFTWNPVGLRRDKYVFSKGYI